MAIPLSEVLDDGNRSMREQAATNNLLDHVDLPDEPFTMRELITPQYGVDDVGEVVAENPKPWENWVGQHEQTRTELRPTDREQLIAAVVHKAYDPNDGEVRAVGSGHSHSNAPEAGDTYIELNPNWTDKASAMGPEGLNGVLDHEGWLRDDLSADHLKRLEAGIILRRLNRHVLHDEGLALRNMGSFDGQTLAGAVNTSTHGTGVGLKSISDSVRSVEIVTVPESRVPHRDEPVVRAFRIEPEEGVTDRDAFEADTGTHGMELIQDDDVFHSVVVGYGCMGVVYAYTMEVIDNYWLREETEIMSWSSLTAELSDDAGDVTEESVTEFLERDDTRHCQILVNTAAEQVPPAKVQDHEKADGASESASGALDAAKAIGGVIADAAESVEKSLPEAHGIGQHEAHRDPVCLVKRHVPAPVPNRREDGTAAEPDGDWVNWTKDQRWPPERRRKPFRDLGKFFLQFHPLSKNHGKARTLHNQFFHPLLNKDPFVGGMHETVWYVALRRLRDREGHGSTNEYYHPEPPKPPTPTTEIGVPVDGVVEAIDEFRETVRDVRVDGYDEKVFFPAPMGIRFTAESSHYLSPEYGRKTAMVELPIPLPHVQVGEVKPVPTLDQDEMRNRVVLPALTNVEQHVRDALDDLGPRPHMGKHNTVDASWLDRNYERFDASDEEGDSTGWYQAYRRFNAFGTFDNAFTDEQLGLDEFEPAG